ncbi:type II toxin-antitoxin system RelE/ParE family toxin [Zophobihabitans entericus]|uniref:Type II toxin-antitoxin system RelE/ParE family toxin n=1 Tax=Zophobihabitans entericus TaxID=1635327 RepID=A0A6G9ICM4_9GAMM|nr:type II toxin-antitoxin system RelE/ParE family toxin [Zophobihabitans entericus]QIQ21454.1 type II toxin-antitoxin system RelE/ParE family toxin [Zophobihabitans entericus]
MLKLIISTRVEFQLLDIYDYSILEWGTKQAKDYIQLLKDKFLLLAENPYIAIKHLPDEPVYRFPVRSHVIYFQLQNDSIEFVAVLHKNELPYRG